MAAFVGFVSGAAFAAAVVVGAVLGELVAVWAVVFGVACALVGDVGALVAVFAAPDSL